MSLETRDVALLRSRVTAGTAKSIPAIERATIDGNSGATRALSTIKEIIETRFGDRAPLAERAITWGDLFARGLAALRGIDGNLLRPPNPGGDVVIIGDPRDPRVNLTPPPAPTGLQAVGGFTVIILTWDPPPFDYYAFTEIFRSVDDNLSNAVKIGTTTANIYDDSGISPGVTYYYWVRFVSLANIIGPFNGVAGTAGTTANNPAFLLALLTGQITESQLYAALNTRINKIEVNETAITTETFLRETADLALAAQISLISAGANTTFDAVQVWNFDADVESWTATNATIGWASGYLTYTSPSGTVELRSPTISPGINGSSYQVVRFRIRRTAGSTWSVSLRWKVGSTWYSKTVSDPSVATNAAATIAIDLGNPADNNWLGQTVVQVGLDIDSTGGDLFDVDWLGIGRDGPAASTAALQQEIIARASADSALASQITTLQASINGNTADIATEASVRAAADGHLGALYSVRIQLTQNGRTVMGGFGLSGTSGGTAGPTIDFGVQADRFWIAPPTGATGVGDILPFVVQTTDTVVNGIPIPRGVYMDGAYINNLSALVAKIGQATIDDAKIGSLSAAKLTVGLGIVGGDLRSNNYVNGSAGWIVSPSGYAEFAAQAIRGQLTANQIDTRNLSLRDANGNVILSATQNLSWSRLADVPPNLGETDEIVITASSNFFKVNANGTPDNTSIVLLANLYGTLSGTVVWSSTAGYTGSFPNSNTFTVQAANQTADAVTYTATLTVGPSVYTDTYTLVRLRDGTVAVNAILSNESHTVPADANGTTLSLAGAATLLTVYVGATDDSANWLYVVTPSNGVTITTAQGGRSVTVTNFFVDAGWVDIAASKSGFATITRRFSLSKSRQGTTGQTGTQGPPGETGATGATGTRGTVHVVRSIAGSTWSNAEANTAIAVAGYGVPQERDMVTLYNAGAQYSEQRFWSGGTWLSIQLYLSGNAFIDGTLGAQKITAGSITADRIVSDGITRNYFASAFIATTAGFASADGYLILPVGETTNKGFVVYSVRINTKGWNTFHGTAPTSVSFMLQASNDGVSYFNVNSSIATQTFYYPGSNVDQWTTGSVAFSLSAEPYRYWRMYLLAPAHFDVWWRGALQIFVASR